MKKILAMIVVLMLALSIPAMAAGEITITHKNLMVVESYSTYAYLFARIENTGDAPITCDDGALVIYDTDNNILETSDWVSTIPYNAYLLPGESVFVREWTILDDGVTAANVGAYEFTLVEDQWEGQATNRIECQVEAKINGSTSYDNYIYVTFTCPEVEPLYGIGVAAAMYDVDGNIVFANYDTIDEVGVHPGSTVTVKLYVDTDIVEHYEKNNIALDTVEAFTYYYAK